MQRSSYFLSLLILAVVPASMYAQAKPAASVNRAISITTEPDAIVWIDGVRFGKTDKSGSFKIRTMSAGAHTIRVRADGFREKSDPITAIQRGEVKVTLVKTTDEAELAYQEAERLTTVDRDKAVEAYRRAIKLKPAFPEAYLALARVQSELGDLDEALKSIAAARRLRPGYAEASAVEGRIQKENGEEAKAIAAFKRGIVEGKGFQPEAYAGLGLLYKEKAETSGGSGDFEAEAANYVEAAKNLKSSIKQLSGAPDALIMYQLLGLIYEKQNRKPEAIALYEEFLRIFPDSTEASAVRSFIVQLKKEMNP